MQLEAGGGGLGNLAQANFLLVVGGLFGAVGIVIVNPAVEVEKFGPAENGLELMQDQTVAAFRLIGLAAAGAVGLVAAFLGGAIGIAAFDLVAGGEHQRAQVGPERDRAERAIAAGGGKAGQIIRLHDAEERLGAGAERRGIIQHVTDHGLDRALILWKAVLGSRLKRDMGQASVKLAETGCGCERGLGHVQGGAQAEQISAQRIGVGRLGRRMGHRRREPEVERAIGRA